MDDMIERAGHAFWQGGLAALPVTVPLTEDGIKAGLLAFAVGGAASVLSLVKGMVMARRRAQKRG